MQKVAQILENYVQWIALALAGLFMAWVIWAYAVHSQVAVQLVGTTPVLPGEIDSKILGGPIAGLNHDIQSTKEISIAVPDLLQPWVASVGGPTGTLALIKSITRWTPYGPIATPGGDPNLAQNTAPIDHLVTAPPAVPVAISQLRTTVEYADPKQPPPDNNAHVQPVMLTMNLDVVSVLFKIEMAKLSKEYHDQLDKKANIPAVAWQTAILKVELIREEKLTNGQWGNSTTIKPLVIHALMDYPGDLARRTTRMRSRSGRPNTRM